MVKMRGAMASNLRSNRGNDDESVTVKGREDKLEEAGEVPNRGMDDQPPVNMKE